MLALPGQKVVVTARGFFWKIATSRWAMFVNAAVAFFLIEKHAGAFVNTVFSMSQHASLVFFFVLGEFLFGLLIRQAEAFGQSLYVAFVDSDPVV